VLVCSKLYVVTRGALVPQMARTDQSGKMQPTWVTPGGRTKSTNRKRIRRLQRAVDIAGHGRGTHSGSIGAGILKLLGAPSVLITASIVYAVATVASMRLQRPAKLVREQVVD